MGEEKEEKGRGAEGGGAIGKSWSTGIDRSSRRSSSSRRRRSSIRTYSSSEPCWWLPAGGSVPSGASPCSPEGGCWMAPGRAPSGSVSRHARSRPGKRRERGGKRKGMCRY